MNMICFNTDEDGGAFGTPKLTLICYFCNLTTLQFTSNDTSRFPFIAASTSNASNAAVMPSRRNKCGFDKVNRLCYRVVMYDKSSPSLPQYLAILS